MYLQRVAAIFCVLQLALHSLALVIGGKPKNIIRQESGQPRQDLVTFDDHSLFVRGERILFYSGEFHPFRLPVIDLWLDVFQKIKAAGYNGVSFYIDWALLEGTEGTIRSDGIFSLEPFFEAASRAGIYLLARPGPYVNAEVSGGGFPGWLGRINGTLRTNATDFLSATDLYIRTVGQQIAQAQITNGGPVILYQVENEYTYPANNIIFPNLEYFDYVINQALDAGVVVPIINNDAGPLGYFAPGNATFGNVTVDIYGHDNYPLGFDCSNPYVWPDGNLPINFRQLHNQQSPSTPYSIIEFQGGSFDPWGGPGFDQCNKLINSQFERVFYKNNWAAGVTIFNQYMIFGGTNWGNVGHPGGYTSYDYAAVIAEDRNVAREKYSEAKLQVNFLKVSPTYLTSVPNPDFVNGTYADTDAIATTALMDTESDTNMYVLRHAAYNSNESTSFTFSVSTSAGNVTIPQLSNYSSTLTLDGRDSKVLVTDYKLGDINVLYSSAEIFTWRANNSVTYLVLYGGANETHEFAVQGSGSNIQTNGTSVATQNINNATLVQWLVTEEAQQVEFTGLNLQVYLLWRNDAYNWWDIELPAESPVSNYSSPSKQNVIVKGPYLVRTAQMQGSDLYLTGEINATTTIELVAAPSFGDNSTIYFNNIALPTMSGQATLEYTTPEMYLPDLSQLTWYAIDTLPELSNTYSDEAWPIANQTTTNNPLQSTTPEVLYASDYGFHTGPLIYRGHFTSPASSNNTTTSTDSSSSLNLDLLTQGGYAYGYQVYLNTTLIYSYPGISTAQNHTTSIPLPPTTQPETVYTLTIVIDHTGLSENFNPGYDQMKSPRGILSYNLTTTTPPDAQPENISVSWRLTGNLGGENYNDLSRGPLNEGGLFFERMGYHLPGAPINDSSAGFTSVQGGPLTEFNGTSGDGSTDETESKITFYATTFALSLPASAYDIPLQFTFTNTSSTTSSSDPSSPSPSSPPSPSTSPSPSPSSTPSQSQGPAPLRANIYVNGYQFGKYINNIGPQLSFPVPEGILNYNGDNYVGVYVWDLSLPSTTDNTAQENGGNAQGNVVKLDGLVLETSSTPTFFGAEGTRPVVQLSDGEMWRERVGAY